MLTSLSVSTVLLPHYASVPCTQRSSGEVVAALNRIAAATGSPLCQSIAYVTDYYGYSRIFELPDSILAILHHQLLEALGSDDPVVRAIAETMIERSRFRANLPERVLLCALLRNRIRVELEIECSGKLYDGPTYTWAAARGFVHSLKWILADLFQKFDRLHPIADRRLILNGCIDADRLI
jgi:hypothetical protein